MSYIVKPPIIVDESGDIDIFESLEAAEQYLEPVDVRDGLFVAYDSEGRSLSLGTEVRPFISKGVFGLGSRRDMIEQVVLTPAESEPTHAEELKSKLIGYFTRRGLEEDWLSRASLEELATLAVEKYKTR